MAKVAVIFYSSTGTNDALARAIAEGAASVSAETRVRLVTETAPPAAISRNPKWQAYAEKMQNEPRAELADLDWLMILRNHRQPAQVGPGVAMRCQDENKKCAAGVSIGCRAGG
jgi:hypothetical protein